MHTPDNYSDRNAILSQAGVAEEDEHDVNFAIVTVCIQLSSSLSRAKSTFLFV